MTVSSSLIRGPFRGRQRLDAALALALVPLTACWPRPWTQTITTVLVPVTVAAAAVVGFLTGPVWAGALTVTTLAGVILVELVAGAWLTTVAADRLCRVHITGADRPARAWARINPRPEGGVTLTNLVAWHRKQGAGAHLVTEVCGSADRLGQSVHLDAGNRRLASWYEQLHFHRTGHHRLWPGIPMVHSPTGPPR